MPLDCKIHECQRFSWFVFPRLSPLRGAAFRTGSDIPPGQVLQHGMFICVAIKAQAQQDAFPRRSLVAIWFSQTAGSINIIPTANVDLFHQELAGC